MTTRFLDWKTQKNKVTETWEPHWGYRTFCCYRVQRDNGSLNVNFVGCGIDQIKKYTRPCTDDSGSSLEFLTETEINRDTRRDVNLDSP